MLNQIIVVGRLVSDPEIKETKNGKKVTDITLAVPRSYRNKEGVYDTDFIPVRLFAKIAETTNEYCKKGDLVGAKGRVARLSGENLEIIAEKVTFLSSRKENE